MPRWSLFFREISLRVILIYHYWLKIMNDLDSNKKGNGLWKTLIVKIGVNEDFVYSFVNLNFLPIYILDTPEKNFIENSQVRMQQICHKHLLHEKPSVFSVVNYLLLIFCRCEDIRTLTRVGVFRTEWNFKLISCQTKGNDCINICV